MLESADQAVLCWEWLRRQRDYQRAALASGPSQPARAWGLHRFEMPERGAPEARPMWTSERFSDVLAVMAFRSADDPDSFTADRLPGLLSEMVEGTQYLSFSNGLQMIRFDVRGRLVGQGPVRFHYCLDGIARLGRSLWVLDRFRRLVTSGRFAAEPRARTKRERAVLVLRSWDALQANATQREIAEVLLRSSASKARWRQTDPSLRAQAQRLARAARTMAAGGYWSLLR